MKNEHNIEEIGGLFPDGRYLRQNCGQFLIVTGAYFFLWAIFMIILLSNKLRRLYEIFYVEESSEKVKEIHILWDTNQEKNKNKTINMNL